MSRSQKPKSPKSANFSALSNPQTEGKSRRWIWILAGLGVLVGLLIGGYFGFSKPEPQNPPSLGTAEYVGVSACKQCHQEEVAAWSGSHHDLAMQVANQQTVLGNFQDARFQHQGIESVFFKRDGRFFVRTDGADGQLADFEIKFTFGVTPLQQYLIEFPGGRLQALSIVWDSRSLQEGGQRWFHLYPNEKIDHNDQLHWTGRYQNWNLQCAECHSTHLIKGYDSASDTYQTRYKAINVSCEACHGPASQHLQWAKLPENAAKSFASKGLSVQLNSRWNQAWSFADKRAKFAYRDQPAADSLMNTCWPCHARRSTLFEGAMPGLPLEDTHHPALLTQPTYHADGQQLDEDYTWGSFRQSKMYQKGVTCMDCHEPHALKLRAEGNALCARCHNPGEFDDPKHHFHASGSTGAQCMNCHAPEQNYMVIDGRHDHSFRLPRPDLSQTLNTPNACNQCHQDQKSTWASEAMDKWYGVAWRQRPHYGQVLQAGVTQGIKALPSLLALAQDKTVPAVVRATASTIAQPSMRADFLSAVEVLLQDADPSVRIAGLGLLESFEISVRIQNAARLLSDPVRGVRIEAGRLLADAPIQQIPADKQTAWQNALKEYRNVLQQESDWPATHINMGNLALRQGDIDSAIAAYQKVLAMDARFVAAYINLADIYRQQGKESEGEALLRQGLNLMPDAADLHHALGLLMVRNHEAGIALKEFETAVRQAPDNARYAFVYAVALQSAGKAMDALKVLQTAEQHWPYDLEILSMLINLQRESGQIDSALVYAKRVAEVMPNDEGIRQLLKELQLQQ